jgi:hypothetical protein
MEDAYKPLVSDETIEKWSEGVSFAATVAEEVRDVYEIHIAEGRLKWVEFAEVHHPSVPEEDWREWLNGSDSEFSMLVTKCCGKNPWCPPWGQEKMEWNESEKRPTFTKRSWVCPGCGNPIKR